ncbi:UNVERIFIED_CONTAM: hypothetical protein HDU68_002566 [Siphonaria sp. JEL0065]|nr:hypothetical protein HDU68_002566 [Siphonaria sp. JEL0065]
MAITGSSSTALAASANTNADADAEASKDDKHLSVHSVFHSPLTSVEDSAVFPATPAATPAVGQASIVSTPLLVSTGAAAALAAMTQKLTQSIQSQSGNQSPIKLASTTPAPILTTIAMASNKNDVGIQSATAAVGPQVLLKPVPETPAAQTTQAAQSFIVLPTNSVPQSTIVATAPLPPSTPAVTTEFTPVVSATVSSVPTSSTTATAPPTPTTAAPPTPTGNANENEEAKEVREPPSALQLLLTKQPLAATNTPAASPAPTAKTVLAPLSVNGGSSVSVSVSAVAKDKDKEKNKDKDDEACSVSSPLPSPPDLQPRKQPVLSRPPSLHPLILKAFANAANANQVQKENNNNAIVNPAELGDKLESLNHQTPLTPNSEKPPRLPSISTAELPLLTSTPTTPAALGTGPSIPTTTTTPIIASSSAIVTPLNTTTALSAPTSSSPSLFDTCPSHDQTVSMPQTAGSLPGSIHLALSSSTSTTTAPTSTIAPGPGTNSATGTLSRTSAALRMSNPLPNIDPNAISLAVAGLSAPSVTNTLPAAVNTPVSAISGVPATVVGGSFGLVIDDGSTVSSDSEGVIGEWKYKQLDTLGGILLREEQVAPPALPSALETLLAPVLMASEKAASLGGVGALESLLAPVVAAGAVGNTTVISISTGVDAETVGTVSIATPRASADDVLVAPDVLVLNAPPMMDEKKLSGIGEPVVIPEELVYGTVPADSLGVHSLKPEYELPVRGILDFISQKDPIHPQITSRIAAWPVRKSGFLFRRDLMHLKLAPNTSNYSSLFPSVRPTTSTLSTLSTNSNSSAKNFGRSFMGLLHSRSKQNMHSSNEYGGPPQMQQQLSQPHPSLQHQTIPQGVVLDARSPSIASTLSYPGLTSGPADDEEDWSLYYVEVRGRYMFFYFVMPSVAVIQAQQQQQQQQQQQSPQSSSGSMSMGNLDTSSSSSLSAAAASAAENGAGRRASISSNSGKRPSSQLSFNAPQLGGFNKLLDKFNFTNRNKAAARNWYDLKRPSKGDMRFRTTNHSPIPPSISQSGSSGGQGGYQAPNNSLDRRNSMDSTKSLSFTPNDIKNAPRTLIHYIPLHLASLEYVFTRSSNSQIFQTFQEVTPPPSTFPSYLSLSVRVGVPSPLDSHPSGMEERLMLDIVDELTWDWTTALANQQNTTTASGQLPTPTDSIGSSTSSTITSKPSPGVKKRELDEWVQAVRLGSLLSFDPLVSTYGSWEQSQLQIMSRVATNASTVTTKASSSSIMSSSTITGGGNIITRSLTKLSFSMGSGESKQEKGLQGGRSSPTLTSNSIGSPAFPEGGSSVGNGGWWAGNSVKQQHHRRESMAQHDMDSTALFGTSPSTGDFHPLSSKPSFTKNLFKGRKLTNEDSSFNTGPTTGINGSTAASLPPIATDHLKSSELKIGSSSPKRSMGELASAPVLSQRSALRGPSAYKPMEPSPLSPPTISQSISAYSWRDRGRSDPPVYDPNAVFPPESPSSPTDVPFPDSSELNIVRKRAMSHSVPKTSMVFPFFQHKKEGGNAGGVPVPNASTFGTSGTTLNIPANGGDGSTVMAHPNANAVGAKKARPTPSRPSLLEYVTFSSGKAMKRNTSNSSRRVPTKLNKGGDKRSSIGTFVSGNETYRSGLEWTGDVPLVLRKCIKLIDEIGLEVEGLYRVSGSATTVQRLERLFESDPTRVHLYPPPDSQIIASLSSPFISDSPVSKRRRGSRLSLTETISSSRSSIDAEALAALASGPMSKIIELGNAGAAPNKWKTNTAYSTALLLGRDGPSMRPPQTPPTEPHRGKKPRRVQDTVIPSSAFSSGSLYDNDVHVVTGVVKSFLRKGLPPKMEPVTTFDLYEAFMGAAAVSEWRDRMIAVQDVVHQLPTENFETLKFICQHLQRVSTFSASNKMGVKNLSIIFCQNLFKAPQHLDNIQRVLSDMPMQCNVVEILIEFADWVFGQIEYEKEELSTAPPPSDRASMISEDESFAPLRKYQYEGKSSRDIFNPSFRRRFSDSEKDSIGDVLDLVPREDTSSRIPDSIRESYADDSSQGYRDFHSDLDDDEDLRHDDDDDDRNDDDDVLFDDIPPFDVGLLVNRTSSSHASMSGSFANQQFGIGGLSIHGESSFGGSETSVLQLVDPAENFGLIGVGQGGAAGNVRRSVEMTAARLNDEKQRRRKTHIMTSLMAEGAAKLVIPGLVAGSDVGGSVDGSSPPSASSQHPIGPGVGAGSVLSGSGSVVGGGEEAELKYGSPSEDGIEKGSVRSSISRRVVGPPVAVSAPPPPPPTQAPVSASDVAVVIE